MRYILLIYGSEGADPAPDSPQATARTSRYAAVAEDAGSRGILQGAERLRPTVDARTVRVRGGAVTASDGPFAETREHLGGYYVVDCQSEAEAIELAARLPAAEEGCVEVRPIWEM
jgi:hypothetical protein